MSKNALISSPANEEFNVPGTDCAIRTFRRLDNARTSFLCTALYATFLLVVNIASVVAVVVVLIQSKTEDPSVPLRLWLVVYALQCSLHTIMGFWKLGHPTWNSDNPDLASGIIGCVEGTNALVACIWWVFGLYWVASGGEKLIDNAPKLYWLSVIFLAVNLLLIVITIGVICIVGTAVCCWVSLFLALRYCFGWNAPQ